MSVLGISIGQDPATPIGAARNMFRQHSKHISFELYIISIDTEYASAGKCANRAQIKDYMKLNW